MLAQHMLANNSRVIFFNIYFKREKLCNLILDIISVILFNIINFMINLIISSDFDNLKHGKILEFFIKSLWVFCK